MNYATVRSFPLFPSLTRGPSLSAAEAQAGAQRGPCRVGPCQHMTRGPPFLGLARVWPSLFRILLCFIISQNCVVIQKYVAPSI